MVNRKGSISNSPTFLSQALATSKKITSNEIQIEISLKYSSSYAVAQRTISIITKS